MASATRRFHIIGSVEVGRCFLVGNLIKRRDIGVGAGFKCGGGMVDVTTVDWQKSSSFKFSTENSNARERQRCFCCFEELPQETRSQLGLHPNLKPVARTAGIGTISQLFTLQILREVLKTSREGDSMVKTKS